MRFSRRQLQLGRHLPPALSAQFYIKQCFSHLLLFARDWNVPFQCLSTSLDGDVSCASQHSERGQFSRTNPLRDVNSFACREDWNGSSTQVMLWFLFGNLGGYYACHTAEFLNTFFILKFAFKCQYSHLLSIQNWQVVLLGLDSLCGEASRKAVLK